MTSTGAAKWPQRNFQVAGDYRAEHLQALRVAFYRAIAQHNRNMELPRRINEADNAAAGNRLSTTTSRRGASRMIVAITGGTGFVGQRLVARHVARGDTVRVLTRRTPGETRFDRSVQHFPGDLTSDDTPLNAFVRNADVIYHCAGKLRRPERMVPLHVNGTMRLIGAASGRIGRWVQLSSVGVYGHNREGSICEATPCEPVGRYEQSKLLSDLLVRTAATCRAFECAILRPSIVFGPTMPNMSLFQWISLIARGRFCFVGREAPWPITCTSRMSCAAWSSAVCTPVPPARSSICAMAARWKSSSD